MGLRDLQEQLEGELYTDDLHKSLYATDASAYREIPFGVAFPKNKSDIQLIVGYCSANQISIIPRAGGTSLAGQCVGNGLVVDVSKHMTKVLEVNAEEGWARVQPGIIRDDLNSMLKGQNLFFAPNTSTSNRATIGGMIGNNSSGSYSIVYGTTRNHVIEVEAVLSDGSLVTFGELDEKRFLIKTEGETRESKIYRQVLKELSNKQIRTEIESAFPLKSIERRNTGYALDSLMYSKPIDKEGSDKFNMCRLIAGSEGTLCFVTEAKVKLAPVPPANPIVLCVHFDSINESMRAVPLIKRHNPRTIELMDKTILDCTRHNIEQVKNSFFVVGDPKAILIMEFAENDVERAIEKANHLMEDLKNEGYGFAYPIVQGGGVARVWNLRKAGLGVLANLPGDKRAIDCIEDTAVTLESLADYIEEFDQLMERYGQELVYYAHAGAGEIHLAPLLNLKDKEDIGLFRQISASAAHLVAKYRGSLSGEHGGGRVRSEFIKILIGERNVKLLERVKATWDPKGIFNPGKIVNPVPMDASLRYQGVAVRKDHDTVLDFSESNGFMGMVEKCSGSGDCRKTYLFGGVMCPSYMATRNERDTTRGRANTLREFLSRPKSNKPFLSPEIKEALSLCLSCKGCKSECPSNVDMAMLKAEYIQQGRKDQRIGMRDTIIANMDKFNLLGAKLSIISNFLLKNNFTSSLIKRSLGIHVNRSLPEFSSKFGVSLLAKLKASTPIIKSVYIFVDEFTSVFESEILYKGCMLLSKLGYQCQFVDNGSSARTLMSRGFLEEAREKAEYNVRLFKDIANSDCPLIGFEPSAILSFRDEYPKLVGDEIKKPAKELAQNTFLFDEFLAEEIRKENVSASQFRQGQKKILLHVHCHQKALSTIECSKDILSLPEGYKVEIIDSSCCGMAGFFGYDKLNYDVSMKIGNLKLFPTIKDADKETIIVATGTSCRHQIKDGASRKSYHPVEVLADAIN